MNNQCKFCGKDCKNKFCSISCRNKFWNPSVKKGVKVLKGCFSKKERISELRTCKCGKQFQVEGTVKELSSYKCRKFCSRACANSRVFSNETNELKSKVMILRYDKIRKERNCVICTSIMSRLIRGKYCSNSCKTIATNIRLEDVDKKQQYRLKCKFRFNPYHYSNILDTNLLKTYGFYSPSNKKNNLGGASMDHKYSIMDGFDNNVDPYYMSHVMNCEILIHNDNISKGRKSKITLNELHTIVDEYDKIHGSVAQLMEQSVCIR